MEADPSRAHSNNLRAIALCFFAPVQSADGPLGLRERRVSGVVRAAPSADNARVESR